MNVLVLSLVTNAVFIPEKYVSPRDEFEAEVSFSPGCLPFLSPLFVPFFSLEDTYLT
jgi:hypothetical protein